MNRQNAVRTNLRRCRSAFPSAVRRPPSAIRPGYTLIELLLVLGVIGALAAVAWPSVLRMQADHDLSAAAEQVRVQLGNGRAWAIKSGVTFQFRSEPKGRHFTVVPVDAEPEPDAKSGNNADLAAARHRFGGELQKGIAFVPLASATTALMSSQKLPPAAFRGLSNASALAAVNWSDPLPFAADGTAQDVVITLGDARGHRIDITIRGLTGAAAVGPMRREANR